VRALTPATSISSDFPAAFDAPLKQANPTLNPHVRYFDGSVHGYLCFDVNRERWLTRARTVAGIATRQSPVTTTASWAAVAGSPPARSRLGNQYPQSTGRQQRGGFLSYPGFILDPCWITGFSRSWSRSLPGQS
jgi:hypothetical protein